MQKSAERDFAEEFGIVSEFLLSKGYKIPSGKSWDFLGIDVD